MPDFDLQCDEGENRPSIKTSSVTLLLVRRLMVDTPLTIQIIEQSKQIIFWDSYYYAIYTRYKHNYYAANLRSFAAHALGLVLSYKLKLLQGQNTNDSALLQAGTTLFEVAKLNTIDVNFTTYVDHSDAY